MPFEEPVRSNQSVPGTGGKPGFDDRVFLVGLFFLQLAIFVGLFAFKGYWLDEVLTLDFTGGSLADLFRNCARDLHPPGYFLLVWLWQRAVPVSEYSLRLVSVIISLPTVPLLYVLVRKVSGRGPALWSCLFLTLSAFHEQFAAQARMYSGLEMFAVLSTLLLVWAEDRCESRRVHWGYAAALAGCIYFHYFGFFVLAAHGLYLLLRDGRAFWRRWTLTYAAALLFVMPCLAMIPGQITGGASGWIQEMQPRGATYHFIADTFFYYVAGEWHSYYSPIAALAMLYLIVPCLAFGIWAAVARRGADGRFPQSGVIPVVLIVPVYSVMTISQIKSIYMPRYLMEIVPFYFALYGIAISLIPRAGIRRVCGTAIAVYLAVSLVLFSRTLPLNDWQQAMKTFKQIVPKERLGEFGVYYIDPRDFPCLDYYMRCGKPEYDVTARRFVPEEFRAKPGWPPFLCIATRAPFDGAGVPSRYKIADVRPFKGAVLSFYRLQPGP
ncbi:glycosyltransferase family 39 protein [bacterium]|nr:glycosyltransferase family 39 protein [bacterium]